MLIEDKEDAVFIPQTKHTISANDYNQIKNEIQNSIKLAGMEPEKDVVQFPTAIKKLTEQSGASEMAKITAEGTKQINAVEAAGAAQKTGLETAGTEQIQRVQNEGSAQVHAAKNWASKTDGPVEGDVYSAKKYAQEAAQSAQNARGLAIGQIVPSQSNLATDNPGCLPLWTGEYYTNAPTLYPDFYAWVKSHPELCKTKAEYDAAIAAYGECLYYVIDEVSGSLRLPKYKLSEQYPWVCAFNAAVPASTAQAAEFTAALAGKANADLSNCPPNYDYVVEHYNDGAGNWYRKYKSGWLEQGGTYTTDSDAVKTITYLKPFSVVPSLLINVSKLTDGATWSENANWLYLVPYNQTTTSFTIKVSIWGGRWEAKGQGAQ